MRFRALRSRRRLVTHRWLATVAVLAVVACALSVVLVAQAGNAVLGTFGATAGGAAGQVSTGTGVSVNSSGAGGVSVNDVYVADRGNNRIDMFTAAGTFIQAWGVGVVGSGPDNTGTSETVSVTVSASGGTFTLTYEGQTTAAITYNATASVVEGDLDALSTIGGEGGSVAVTGGPGDETGSKPYVVTFGGALKGVEGSLTASASGLSMAVGGTLTCTAGPSTATTKTFRWLRNGAPIAGATSSTYTTVSADAEKAIQCQVFAINSNAGATQVSTTVAIVSPFPATVPPNPPASIAAPSKSANLTVGGSGGQALTCAPGTWTGTPTFGYQWYRNGVALSGNGANTSVYTVQAADVATAAAFQCAVTGTNGGGAATHVSANVTTTAAPSPAAPVATSTVPTPVSGASTVTTPATAPFEMCVVVNGDTCRKGRASAVAGGMGEVEAVAVDQKTGNIYVADGLNHRIDVFSANGAFEGAFGWKVNKGNPEEKLQFCTTASGCQTGAQTALAGGFSVLSKSALAVNPSNGDLYVGEPGNYPGVFTGFPTGNHRINEFSITLNGSNEVTAVSFVRAFGGNVISGGATATANTTINSATVEGITMTSKAFAPGQAISGPGIAPGTIITEVITGQIFNSITLSKPAEATATGVHLTAAEGTGNVPRNEKQLITVTATGGNFKLKFETTLPNASLTTANIPVGATALEVENALKGLSNISSATIGTENVAVSGPAGGPYTVEFKGTRFADTNVPQLILEAGSPALSGGSATVVTTVEGTNPEICTVATGCQAGTPGAEGGFFPANTPSGLAVDSAGHIYATSAEGTCSATNPCRVQEFNSGGTFKEAFGPSAGGATECQLNWAEGAAGGEAAVGVALDPGNQNIVVTRKPSAFTFEVCTFNSSGVLLEKSPATPPATSATTSYLTPAISSSGNVYVNDPINAAQGAIYIIGPVPAPSAEVSPATEVGVTIAELHGRVTVPSPGGEGFNTIYHFEYSGDNGLSWISRPVPDAPAGSVAGPHAVSETVTGLQPNLTYRVRLVATTGPSVTSSEAQFTTLNAMPSISGMLTNPVGKTSATLAGLVNPNNSSTTYHFEWGTTTAYGNEVPNFDAYIGSGGSPNRVSASLNGLELGATYHFRIAATNAAGTAYGPDEEFTTLDAAGLPNDRAYELVSPANKGPVGKVASFFGEQVLYQAADSGNSVSYSLLNGLPDATAGGNLLYLAHRSASGWQSEQQSPPSLIPSSNGSGKIYFNSPALTCSIVKSTMPLTADTSEESVRQEYEHLYRRSPDGSYTLLTPDPLSVGTAHLTVDGATADCGYVLFESSVALLSGDPAGLYEWNHGVLRFTGVLPNGSLATNARAGGAENWSNAISPSGSRAFFSATRTGGGTGVFVRENGTTTIEASKSQTATPDTGTATYQLVSKDGANVFFTGMYGLTSPSSHSGGATCCDLYDYNADTGVLTDRSIDENAADTNGPEVIGVLDASADGSYVYFAAKGQLIPEEGNTYNQNRLGFANVYLNHNGTLSYIGVIEEGRDTTNSGNDLATRFGEWVSDATPNGKHLLFESHANVTGFNNAGRAAIYLYSAESNETVCVSCRPDGQPSLASSDRELIRDADEEGLARKPQRPRALSEDGRRVVFTSPDVLAPGGIEGADNLYEWEGGHVFLLLAGEHNALLFPSYVEMSPSGDDVFVKTLTHLVGEDVDTVSDLYDIRAPHVAGEPVGEPVVPPSPVPCDPSGEACQGLAALQPGAGPTPASEEFFGPGDLTQPAVTGAAVVPRPKARALTRSQQLAKALKVCRKKPKHKRAGCEAQARKRYAAKSKVKKSDGGAK